MGRLELQKISLKLNGKPILKNINIDFWEGYIHAIVGPNGAGKSTLAFTIMGLEGYRSFEGDILFKGLSLKDLSIDERAKRGITLAWQEPARYEGLRIKDFLASAAREKSEKNISDTLIKVGMEPTEYLKRALDKTLSGGERKKIEIASILVMEPELVLLDEPDSGIDIESLEKIFEIIQLLKKKKTTVILITHSLAVLKQADHAFLMCHGDIIDKGETKKIIPYFENKCIPCGHKNFPNQEERKNGE
ncbi:MAG: ABC transporter ATP-binding protein [Spirochaetes bacterium]|nr:ABC transporter ATP-binding protein [Spirochaetota bacterium]